MKVTQDGEWMFFHGRFYAYAARLGETYEPRRADRPPVIFEGYIPSSDRVLITRDNVTKTVKREDFTGSFQLPKISLKDPTYARINAIAIDAGSKRLDVFREALRLGLAKLEQR